MGECISARQLNKWFRSLHILSNWNLSIPTHQRVVLLGPSGSGKTTFLRMVAGLDTPDSGDLHVGTERIAFVFQEPRLIPWRTVGQNLKLVNPNGAVEKILADLRLQGFADYYPAQLSGGMRQRVNLARALLVKPQLMLLDEAFSFLDQGVKWHIMEDLLAGWRKNPFTMLMVTHDLKEALYVADRILILSRPPTVIAHDFQVPLGHNRSLFSPDLLRLEGEILQLLTQ